MPPNKRPHLRIVPLGGLGEIGKNMMVVEYGDDMLLVDAGIMFPEEDMPGIDLVIPDLSYVLERKEKLRGIAITHGHEDHIGALPYVLSQIDTPVYASRLTVGLIKVRLREHKNLKNPQIHEIMPGDHIPFGGMDVEFFRVCHSIPDAMGVAIRTPLGIVVHTGDFKFDHTPVDGRPADLNKLASLGAEGVLLLMSDSTYAEVPGYTPSEQVVGEALDRVISRAQGRVIVASFASLISRMQQVADAAVRNKRRIAFVGRSMSENSQMAIKLGYLKIPETSLARVDELEGLPPERCVIMTTGAQGEPTSALVRMANNDHRDVDIRAGDTVVISATPIPGNETLVSRTIDNLMRRGAIVLHDRLERVHVHGHAAQEELKAMISLTKPKYFVPLHGEYRHLVAHANIAKALGVEKQNAFVMEDGDTLEIDDDGAHRGEHINAGPIYVDGLARWDGSNVVLRDRRTLSRDGIVVAFLAFDRATSKVIGTPELISYGFLDADERDAVLAKGRDKVIEALDNLHGTHSELTFIHTHVAETLRQYFFSVTKRRPMIIPVAMEL